MRSIMHNVIGAMASFALIGYAAAAELNGAEIKDLLSGKTIYLETTANSATGTAGQGVIYFAADGTALYKTAKGVMWHGKWEIKGDTNCSNWKEAPDAPCTKYEKQGDMISLVNAATGQVRGKITKIAAGNAEKLAP
jgi:hypothetical protein